MIAIFNMPTSDFDYSRIARAVGLRVVHPNQLEFVVAGEPNEINQFAAELDFEPKVRAATLMAALSIARGLRD